MDTVRCTLEPCIAVTMQWLHCYHTLPTRVERRAMVCMTHWPDQVGIASNAWPNGAIDSITKFVDLRSLKGYTALHFAVVEENMALVRLLLDEYHTDVNVCANGRVFESVWHWLFRSSHVFDGSHQQHHT
jgi:hypothetical protein